jgi:hypothetical protein
MGTRPLLDSMEAASCSAPTWTLPSLRTCPPISAILTNGYFDAVTLDGPYKLNGTATKAVDGRYGVDTYAGPAERHGLICDGMTECTRVLRVGGVLLVKCQDQVCSGRIWWQTDIFTRHGESLGLVKVDRFDMLGTGRPQPPRSRADGKPSVQQHGYGRPSTLLVFRKSAASVPLDLFAAEPPRPVADIAVGGAL